MRVLLVRAGALGDALLLWHAVAGLRAAGHQVSLMAPSSAAGALVGPGGAEEVLPWEDAAVAALLAGNPSATLASRLRAVDAAIAYTRNFELITQLGRLVPRILPHDPRPPSEGPHASEWLAQPLRALGVPVPASIPSLEPTAAERLQARHRHGLAPGFLAIHPGSGSLAKNWPLERFARLAEVLSAGRPWLLTAGPAEVERGIADLPGAYVAREWPVRLLLAALADAGLFLGNDSGVTHLAAAAGTPTVALFGPTDPALWAPVGQQVTVLRSADGTMAGIHAETVLSAIRSGGAW